MSLEQLLITIAQKKPSQLIQFLPAQVKLQPKHAILQLAAAGKTQAALQALVEQGVDLNAQDTQGNTALYQAVKFGNSKAVTALILVGAALNIKNEAGRTALYLAAMQGKLGIAQQLIAHQAKLNISSLQGNTALHKAARYGHLDVVQALINAKAKLNLKNHYGNSALHIAVRHGHHEIVQALIAAKAMLNRKNHYGNSALHNAIRYGQLEIAQSLLNHRADINLENNLGNSILHIAIRYQQWDMVPELLNQGININAQNQQGYSALHLAASEGNLELVKSLIEHGADLHLLDKQHYSALSQAIHKGHFSVAEMLVKQGANINAQDNVGNTALHHGVRFNHLNAIYVAIALDIDLDLKNNYGRTALYLAAKAGNTEIAHILLANEAELDEQTNKGKTALHIAAQYNQLEIMQALIENGAAYLQNYAGDTALHIAVRHHHYQATEMLLDAGIDINLTNHKQQRAIELAPRDDNLLLIHLLQANGAQTPNWLAAVLQQAFNDPQSTHNTATHASTAAAALRLQQCYVAKNLAASRQACFNWSLQLPKNAKALVARRAIEQLMNNEAIPDQQANISLQDILALVWCAINDKKALGENKPKLTHADIEQRRQSFIDYLYEYQRGDNLNKYQEDDQQPDKPICHAGAFNKLIMALEGGRHFAVNIVVINSETIFGKMQSLVNEQFKQLATRDKRRIAKQWRPSQGMPEHWSIELKPILYPKLIEEFGVNHQGLINKNLEFLSYLEPTSSVLEQHRVTSMTAREPLAELSPAILLQRQHHEQVANNTPVMPEQETRRARRHR
jgi:ankyrin repeat protein